LAISIIVAFAVVMSCLYFVLFFFSSRRRHTRFSRDWSSDVCSSDLAVAVEPSVAAIALLGLPEVDEPADQHRQRPGGCAGPGVEIGRASSRERVSSLCTDVSFMKIWKTVTSFLSR